MDELKPVFCADCRHKRVIAAIIGGKCKAGFYQRHSGYAGSCHRFTPSHPDNERLQEAEKG